MLINKGTFSLTLKWGFLNLYFSFQNKFFSIQHIQLKSNSQTYMTNTESE